MPGPKAHRHGLIPEFMAEIARVVIGTSAAADDLRLGGANALAEFYLGHRLSLDLDFFAMDPGRVEAVALELIDRLSGSGLVADVKVARRFADFQRLSLIPAAGGSELDVDLGRWMPPQLYPPVMVGGIRVEAFREPAMWRRLRPDVTPRP